MGKACSANDENRSPCRLMVGTAEGKRALGRPRRRWVVNIKMDLAEIGWGIGLAQDSHNAVMILRVP
jgi:hypothetical protein